MIGTLAVLAVLCALAVTSERAKAAVQLIRTIQTFQGLTSDTKPSGVVAGSTFYETDTGKTFLYNGSSWLLKTNVAYSDTVAMFAPGVSRAVYSAGHKSVTWYYVVSAINTSVTVALQARKLPGAWTTIDANVSQTANGNYGLTWTAADTADSVRFNWLSEVGGTAAIIVQNACLAGGN